MHHLLDSALDERVAMIVPPLSQPALEMHCQIMWERGYRLEGKINGQKYFDVDG